MNQSMINLPTANPVTIICNLGPDQLKLTKLNWRIDRLGWKKIEIVNFVKRVTIINGISREKKNKKKNSE